MQPVNHIMLWRFSSMGDLAILEPVLRNLLVQYPHLRLTLVSRPKFKAFFTHLKQLEYCAVDLDVAYKGISGLWKLATHLKKYQADVVLDLHQVLRTTILRQIFYLRWGIHIPFIQKDRQKKRALAAAKPDKNRLALKPTYQRYADVLDKIGFSISWEKPLAPKINFAERNSVILPLLPKIKTTKKIGLAPFGRYLGKSYPPDMVKELIEQLIIIYPHSKIYLFGGGKDQLTYFNNWATQWPKNILVSKAINLSLVDELALMSQLDLMIAVDSANMQMAAMVEIPIVSLWGATHPFFGFYPWQQPIENAILADLEQYPTLPCSVNGKRMHKGAEHCMRSITVTQIIQKVKEITKH